MYLNVDGYLEPSWEPEGEASDWVLHIAQDEQVKEEPVDALYELKVVTPLVLTHCFLCGVWSVCVYVCVCGGGGERVTVYTGVAPGMHSVGYNNGDSRTVFLHVVAAVYSTCKFHQSSKRAQTFDSTLHLFML